MEKMGDRRWGGREGGKCRSRERLGKVGNKKKKREIHQLDQGTKRAF
jgi:hypothetical protein